MGTIKSRYTAEQIKKFQNAWTKCVVKAWTDEKFKQKLLKNPEAALREMGAELPADLQFKILENSPKARYLVLREKPTGDDLTEQDMLKVAGGVNTGGLVGATALAATDALAPAILPPRMSKQ
jgi:hypothetical protein